jgi:hypothetical protein
MKRLTIILMMLVGVSLPSAAAQQPTMSVEEYS